MGAWKKMLVHVAWSGLFLSGFLSATLPVVAQQGVTETRGQHAADSQPLVAKAEPAAIELPDSPGATASKSEQSAQTQNSAPAPNAPPTQSQPQATQPQASPSATPPQRPVGTAAAEAPNASGIAASQPAGVAIAPAKQHRVRTIVLRMGAIVGAGVAVGSVVALTAATPSKPPGAH